MTVVRLAVPATRRSVGETVDWFEKVLVVAAFLVFLGAFKTILLSGGDDRAGGSALFQAVTGSIYLASMAIVLSRGIPAWLPPLLYRAWPLVLLTLLPLFSTFWSQDPGPTLRRAIALILSTWFALYVVIRFTPRDFFNLLTIAFAMFVAATVAAAVVPGLGITPGGAYAGAWRGLTGNKNELGRSIALAVALLPTIAVLRMTDLRRTAVAVGAVAFPVLLLSQSATSLMSAVLALAVGSVVYVLLGGRIGGYRLRAELGAPLAFVAVVGGFLLFTVAWTPVLEALGRDPTLTGRTKLWDWALAQNEDRRWLGSGYRAFWINKNTRYFFLTFAWNKGPEGDRSDTYAGPTHAHSGYVDLILELGLVGLGTFAVMISGGFLHLRHALARGSPRLSFIFAVIMVFLLVYAITARSVLQQAEGLWNLFCALYLFSIKESLTSTDVH